MLKSFSFSLTLFRDCGHCSRQLFQVIGYHYLCMKGLKAKFEIQLCREFVLCKKKNGGIIKVIAEHLICWQIKTHIQTSRQKWMHINLCSSLGFFFLSSPNSLILTWTKSISKVIQAYLFLIAEKFLPVAQQSLHLCLERNTWHFIQYKFIMTCQEV